jgi:hypothetical protein
MINSNVSLEIAKSNASICKSCKEKIKKDTFKVVISGGIGFGGYPIKYSLCGKKCGVAHLKRFIHEFEDMIKKLEGEINDKNTNIHT